jgi:CheY-like chemotaxis protein
MNIFSNLSREKKIYFSSYAIDDEYFIISLRESYSSLSGNLRDKLNTFFNKDESSLLKEYGITKLTAQLSKSMLNLLKGRFALIEIDNKQEAGFIFPISFSVTEREVISRGIPGQVEEIGEEILSKKSSKDSSPEEELKESESTKDESVKVLQLHETEYKPSGPGTSAIDLSQLSCIYVEDQVDSQTLFKVQMKELKDIQFAINFEDALPLLTKYHFDFIVVDINLPGDYNGLDILRIIRRMHEYESIPVIAVTAYLMPDDKEKFIRAGFSDFIPKPVFKEKMMDSLEKIFLAYT